MPGGLESRLMREQLRAARLQNAQAAMDFAGPGRDIQEAAMLEALFGAQQRNALMPLEAASDMAYRAGSTGNSNFQLYDQLLSQMGLGGLLQEGSGQNLLGMLPQQPQSQFDPETQELARQAMQQYLSSQQQQP